MEDLRACYAVLELDEGASPDRVDEAYRELTWVWHPDRFSGDLPALRERALQKQQQINAAYERLVAVRDQTPSVPITAADQPPVGQPSGVTVVADPGGTDRTVRSALSQVEHLVIDHLVPVLRTTVVPAILRQLSSRRGDAGRTADGPARPQGQRPRDGRGAGRGDGSGRGARGPGRGRGGGHGRRR